jgi:predicted component of type VI protein secretion system
VNLALKIHLLCGGQPQTYEFARFPVHIGRDARCELQLEHRFVSRRHARIERVGNGLVLIDENSRNGITCNGTALAPRDPVPLTNGSEIRIKRLTATIHIVERKDIVEGGVENDRETTLYAEQHILPEIVDRVRAAIDACPAARTAAASTIAVSLNAVAQGQPHPMPRPGVGSQPTELAQGPNLAPNAHAAHASVATRPNVEVLLEGLEEPWPPSPSMAVPVDAGPHSIEERPCSEPSELNPRASWRPPWQRFLRGNAWWTRLLTWARIKLARQLPPSNFLRAPADRESRGSNAR